MGKYLDKIVITDEGLMIKDDKGHLHSFECSENIIIGVIEELESRIEKLEKKFEPLNGLNTKVNPKGETASPKAISNPEKDEPKSEIKVSDEGKDKCPLCEELKANKLEEYKSQLVVTKLIDEDNYTHIFAEFNYCPKCGRKLRD